MRENDAADRQFKIGDRVVLKDAQECHGTIIGLGVKRPWFQVEWDARPLDGFDLPVVYLNDEESLDFEHHPRLATMEELESEALRLDDVVVIDAELFAEAAKLHLHLPSAHTLRKVTEAGEAMLLGKSNARRAWAKWEESRESFYFARPMTVADLIDILSDRDPTEQILMADEDTWVNVGCVKVPTDNGDYSAVTFIPGEEMDTRQF